MTRRREIAEYAIIALGLLSFWPYVFGHRSLWYSIALAAVLALLAWLAVVRLLRVRRGLEEKLGGPQGPGRPWRGPGAG